MRLTWFTCAQMGLGKTAQSISVLAFQKQFGGVRGPFLGEQATPTGNGWLAVA
jgi:hypothetical protein